VSMAGGGRAAGFSATNAIPYRAAGRLAGTAARTALPLPPRTTTYYCARAATRRSTPAGARWRARALPDGGVWTRRED